MNTKTLQMIMRKVRVCCLKEYYITQVLPQSKYFEVDSQTITAIMDFQKRETESSLLPLEWCLPERHFYECSCETVQIWIGHLMIQQTVTFTSTNMQVQ